MPSFRKITSKTNAAIEELAAKRKIRFDFSSYADRDKAIGILAEALRKTTTTEELLLLGFDKKLGNDGANKIADALRFNNSLRELWLPGNGIGKEGAKKLANALKDNAALEKLGLADNQIGKEGVEKLADALRVNQTLRELQLKGNAIGDEGAEMLANALSVNQSLKELGLAFNRIGDDGAGKLADALMVNKTLERLELGYNVFKNEGAKKFVRALNYNGTIHTIRMSGISVSEELVNQIKDMLAKSHRKDIDRPPETFFGKIIELENDDLDMHHKLEELSTSIEDVHMMKLYYTAVSSLLRSGILSKEEASEHLKNGLAEASEKCTCEDALAIFKLVLEKAEHDGHIQRGDFHRFDNRAEIKRMEHAPFIRDMQASIKENTAMIERLEANVVAINQSLDQIRKGLKLKLRVETTVGILCAAINVLTFGSVGSCITAGMAAFLEQVVDFGECVHLEMLAEKMGDDSLMSQVQTGMDVGFQMAASESGDILLARAVTRGAILTAITAAAVMTHPPPLPLISMVKGIDSFDTGTAGKGLTKKEPSGRMSFIDRRPIVEEKITDNELSVIDELPLDQEKPLDAGQSDIAEHPSNQEITTCGRIGAGMNDEIEKETTTQNLFVVGQVPGDESNNIDDVGVHQANQHVEDLSSNGQESKSRTDHMPQDRQIKYLTMTESQGEVENWLSSYLPQLQKEDVNNYCKCLMEDGFDSIDMLKCILEEDLSFMKKGHKRQLMKRLLHCT